MVRKKLAIAILALSALQANLADAMGLGNLSVKSALNQPLSAEIKLLDLGDLDPSQIKIRLAAPEDFQRAGVDRDYFLTNLRFDVTMDGHGGGTVKVTTREPVVEPYLNFVVEARWPNGRLLREFAVLLDPPTFSANKATAPVTPAASAAAQSAKPRAVQPPTVKTETETATAAPAADMSLPAAAKSGEYRVQVYDTLSKIASRNKPASDVSVAQTMVAIQRANPQAFIRNNVNLIKSGSVLRMPNADEARAVTTAQAAQEVDTQMQDWRGSRSSGSAAARTPAAGPQLDASAPEPTKKEGGFHEQARLSIATAGDAEKAAKGGAGSGKGLDGLRQQLSESQESLEKGKRDNKELQSRLDDMERQIATLQRLISLKDDQLAALQSKSAGAKPAPQSAPAAGKIEAPAPAPAVNEQVAATVPADTKPAPEVVAPAPAVPAPEAKPIPAVAKPAPKLATPAPQSGHVDQIVANPSYYLYGGIGAMVVGLAVAYMAKRRKAEEAEAQSDSLPYEDDNTLRFDTDTFDHTHGDDTTAVAEASAEVEAIEESAAEAPKKGVRSETGDPIAESDIYIAYGRYQQAVDLLTHAIDAEPSRSDLRVKLLEVYVEMRNKDAFRQQFVGLQDLGDSNAVAHVKDLLSSVDGIADWLEDLPGASSVSLLAVTAGAAAVVVKADSAVSDLDLDFDSELAFEEPVAPTANLDVGPSDDLAGFDTGVSDDLAALESSFSSPINITNEENPVDLDLSFDGELGSTETEVGLAEDFLSEPAPSFDTPSFESEGFNPRTDSFNAPTDSFNAPADSFNASPESFSSPSFESTTFEPAKLDESGAVTFEEEGLELDLGEDDLDQALSRMDDTESLGDLEEVSTAQIDLDTQPVPAPVDLSAEFGVLPEEFDLSQPGTQLPEVDRSSGNDFGDFSFEEPSFTEPNFGQPNVIESSFDESNFVVNAEPQPEIDVFAGLSQPSPAPVQPIADVPDLDGGDDFDFLADADEVATKLDLARAYIDMGDTDGAKDILDEVLHEGTDTQKQEASTLLTRIG